VAGSFVEEGDAGKAWELGNLWHEGEELSFSGFGNYAVNNVHEKVLKKQYTLA